MNRWFLISVLCGFAFTSSAQYREYSHNAPGNRCYIEKFLNYAPNGNLSLVKRPFIFVLGEPNSSAKETFEKDSLHLDLNFFNYEFIYLPNLGNSSADMLPCIVPLADLVTKDFECGRSNVFLMIYDTTCSELMLEQYGLLSSFHSIRIIKPTNQPDSVSISDDFKEDRDAYEQSPLEKDDIGTYYIDNSADKDASNQKVFVQAKKTYFGAPTRYDYTLTGLVRDNQTGESLPFSSIKIRGMNSGAVANVDGLFTLFNVPSDTSVLIVSYSGYDALEVYLTPELAKRNMVLELSSSVQAFGEVEVFADRQDIVLSKKEDFGVVKMTPKLISKLPNLGEKDVMRAFQLMPGVSGSQESSSGMYVRGGTPDQNLVLYDGFTVYHVDHLYGFFSAFNANTVKEVQLYKGGYESRFGGRLSSVTEITGKEGNKKRFNIGGDLSLLSLNVFAEVPIGDKFTSIVAFRRSFKSPVYTKLFEKFNSTESDEGEVDAGGGGPGAGGGRATNNTELTSYFYDLTGKFTYRPSAKDIISLSLFNSKDVVDNSSSFDGGGTGVSGGPNFSFSNTDLTTYGNFGSSLRWGRKWSDKTYGNTVFSFSNFFSNRDQSNERVSEDDNGDEVTSNTGILEDNNLIDYSVKSDFTSKISKNFELRYGVFGTYYDIDYQYVQNDTSTILNKSNQSVISGGYIQNKFKFFSNKILVTPGIRVNYFGMTNSLYFEPRASAVLKLTKRISLKGATGKYNQFVNRVTREDILAGSKEFWLLSDGVSVPVSSSIHYMGGLSYETSQFLFSAEGYYKELNDITEYSLRITPSATGSSYDENFFSGKGDARGIELLAQRKRGKINGWMSYTLGEARSYFDVYSDEFFYANQDVTHEFKTVLMYNYKRWDFSATWVYATGRPYTAPSGAYTVTLLDGTTQDFFTVTEKNGLRLPNYHKMDISVNYKLLGGTKGDVKRREIGSLSFSIFNLYNRKNVWYKTYSVEDGTILETNVNYTGITPNLTLSLKLR